MTYETHLITALFYLAFISQIYLLSYRFPRKLLARARHVYATYPPADYPKLYPGASADQFPHHMSLYGGLNHFTLFVGAALILGALITGYQPQGNGEETIVAFYAIGQFFSLMLLSVWEFKNFKKMRDDHDNPVRTADLQPRRLFDFIAPGWVILAASLLLANLSFVFLSTDFSQGEISDFFWEIAGPILVNLYFLAFGTWFIYGRKLNPHQSPADRRKEITISVKAMVYSSIMISLFFMIDFAVKKYDVAYLQPIIWSLYFQLIGALSFSMILQPDLIKNMDFSVYKSNGTNH